ncbi:YokU family protein [Metabacillus herbersteinensis]|uniref:YokU family protein n=1 Tax=Metabacillus herbersteinensis TaxID=283816 RepID=A0ABV6GKW7_9BACI
MTKCEWCGSSNAKETTNNVYWELPDGSRAIEIHNTPCIDCLECGMEYQQEDTINTIENHLLLISIDNVPDSLTFEELMSIKKHLKRNYFDF